MKKVIEKDADFGVNGKKQDIEWETENVEARSETTLEDDKGEGKELILRFFEFTANPEAFKDRMPSAQELFNAHARQMEVKLWEDGVVVDKNIEPRLLFSKDKTHYKFVIGCRVAKGQILTSTPLTLSELAK